MKSFRTLTPQLSSYLYRRSQKKKMKKKMILRDNPGSRRIRPEDNTALSTHGEICLRYDLLDSNFLFFFFFFFTYYHPLHWQIYWVSDKWPDSLVCDSELTSRFEMWLWNLFTRGCGPQLVKARSKTEPGLD